MNSGGKWLPLAFVGALVTIILGISVVTLMVSWFSNPPFGLGNAPPQPIAFPHNTHVKEGINCEFCHRNVTRGDSATVPAVEQCMFCHKQINPANLQGQTAVNLNEIAKVTNSFETSTPINWERVHRLPDHVRFVHEAHIRAFTTQSGLKDINGDDFEVNAAASPSQQVEQVCAICHGDVRNMAEVQPQMFQSLKMGTCLDCHRNNNAPTDCTVCHK